VAKFLTDDWLDAVRSAAKGANAGDLSVRLEITAGDVLFHAVITSGTLDELALGALNGAEVALTLPFDDAVAVQRGELDPSVAFMQGRMKTAGNPGKLLDLLARTARPGYAQLRDAVAAVTDF
jgi:putative sterol carrier protein